MRNDSAHLDQRFVLIAFLEPELFRSAYLDDDIASFRDGGETVYTCSFNDFDEDDDESPFNANHNFDDL